MFHCVFWSIVWTELDWRTSKTQRKVFVRDLKKMNSVIDDAKGQIISEQKCGVLNFPKMQRNIARISALASKMGQIKKIKASCYVKW